jgi:fused signal recognition particle receptor
MAFGFIKKVFSFGKKEVVEEKPDETAPLPPLNFEALKPLPDQTPVEPTEPAPEAPTEAPEVRPEPAAPLEPAVTPAAKPVQEAGPVAAAEPLAQVEPEATSPSPSSHLLPDGPEPVPTPERPVTPEPKAPTPNPREIPKESKPSESAPRELPPETEPKKPESPEGVPESPKQPVEIPVQPPQDEPVPETREVPSEPIRPEPEPARPEPAPQKEVPPAPAPEPEKPEIAPPASETPQPPAEAPPQKEPASQSEEIAAPPEPAPTEAPVEAPAPLASALREGRAEGAGEGASSSTVASDTPTLRVDLPGQATGLARPSAPLKGEGAIGRVTVSKKVEQKAEPAAAPTPEPRKSWFQRMRDGLARSSRELTGNISGVFTKRKLDEDTLQDLEDILIRADLGVETALRVTDSLASSRYGKSVSDEEVRIVMAEEIGKVLTPVALPLELDLSHKPHVILVVGVNGTGKTTTIGKLAAKLTEGGLSVMLGAGDTFRAAAIEQLKIWGERTSSPVVATKLGADAAGLAYDAFEQAKAAGSDVLIIDTAGRLQNKAELMSELEKIVRVLGKLDPEAPHTVLQTVDATTGQNALNQVEIFRNVAGVNGLVMTKLDGTARGGILVAIAARHKLPVYFIGVGEQVDDLEPFSASEFARAIAGVA